MKIVVLDGFTLNPGDLSWEYLERLGNCTLYERTPFENIIERCKDAEMILTNKVPLNKETINQLPKLEYIGVTATGYNVVDTEFARSKGITVTNAAGYSSSAVVQHTFALMLAAFNRVAEHSAWAKEHWARHSDFSYTLSQLPELSGKTLGLIGFGDIGSRVGTVAQSFGMKVLVHRKNKEETLPSGMEHASLQEISEKADVISLHCPLTAETNKMINAGFLAKMKQNALLINTGRGQLIDEEALAIALRDKKIMAALDVLSQEPPEKDHPLLKLDNCIITPHIAWASFESRKRLLDIVCQNIRAYMMGEPENVVN